MMVTEVVFAYEIGPASVRVHVCVCDGHALMGDSFTCACFTATSTSLFEQERPVETQRSAGLSGKKKKQPRFLRDITNVLFSEEVSSTSEV